MTGSKADCNVSTVTWLQMFTKEFQWLNQNVFYRKFNNKKLNDVDKKNSIG
jgi:hypothetical protein